MTPTTFKAKNTSKNLSQQVKEILTQRGFSFLFNYNDYSFFKSQCKNAFNKAQAIADKFIEENQEAQSDFNQYVF
jgi:hypothetical protein